LVGAVLQKEREKKGLSLKEIAARTHIRLDYLKDLEEGEYSRIPSEIYVKGYLRAYAAEVGLDPAEIISMYCAETEKTETECAEAVPPEPEESFIRRAFVPAVLAVLAVIAVAAVVYYFSDDPVPPRTAAVATPSEDSPAPPRDEKRHLRIVASGTTWVMIVIDNSAVEEYILKKGDVLVKEARDGFYLKIGNAGGVSIFLDNENVGPLGAPGEVVKISLPGEFRPHKKFRDLFSSLKPSRRHLVP